MCGSVETVMAQGAGGAGVLQEGGKNVQELPSERE